MRPTEKLHEQGQSLWLDNITRELLASGTLRRYIDELSITGLTSNPTIFHNAVKDSTAYDDAIGKLVEQGKSGEDLFSELDIDALASQLQDEGAAAFVKSWNELIEVIASKSTAIAGAS